MKTILLIDDNADVRMVISEVLELSNYKVEVAEDGKEGITYAVKNKPDLIICDVMMPGLDGYAVIHALQRNPETQHIPFIFLSARAERTDVRKGMELGADDYLTKPLVSAEELLNAVESRLKKAELLRKELSPGLEGLNDLVSSVGGKDILESITEGRNSVKYKKRQLIYSEGALPQKLYYIKRGKIKIYKTNDDGKELVTNLAMQDEFFGYTAIIEEGTYQESAEAMEDSEVVIIPADDFKMLLSSSREVLRKFIQLLANNITERENKLLNIAYSSLRKKVATALVEISAKYNTGDDPNSSINIGRENLANITGTAKESVIRTLSDFKDEKLIDIRDGQIILLNRKKLEQMLN